MLETDAKIIKNKVGLLECSGPVLHYAIFAHNFLSQEMKKNKKNGVRSWKNGVRSCNNASNLTTGSRL
ncbi:MAG: hypothetical protein CTY18_05285 [Methylomonas sp.]|nr:MAG: hypothetical protein CTY18_05285 [Methylomonas sp.]